MFRKKKEETRVEVKEVDIKKAIISIKTWDNSSYEYVYDINDYRTCELSDYEVKYHIERAVCQEIAIFNGVAVPKSSIKSVTYEIVPNIVKIEEYRKIAKDSNGNVISDYLDCTKRVEE